jgi:hypothetical protein
VTDFPLESAEAGESNPFYIEALDLFDRCLTNGNLAPIISFVEQQIARQPTDFDLLRNFADDLQQRIVSLRTNLYDLRNNLVALCAEQYHTDITSLIPAEALAELYLVVPASVLDFVYAQHPGLAPAEQQVLIRYVDDTIQTAIQIQGDMEMTELLYDMVLDWFDALCADASRHEWWDARPPLGDLPH